MFTDRRLAERRLGERRKFMRDTIDRRQVDRRQLLKIGAVATVTSLFGHPVVAKASQMLLPNREISLYNTHTGEKLTAEYFTAGKYAEDALQEINHILRDFRTGEVKSIDTELLDLLHDITAKTKPGAQIHIISGFRSPATNQSLTQNGGVAKHSLHMDGKAIDLRIPGYDLSTLRKVALSMESGGVGYYEKSNFVHVDTGRVRFW